MNLIISLRSEILKTKRTAAFYFTLIGAALIPFLFLINSITDGLPDEGDSSKDPLNGIFMLSTQMTGIAIFPLFVVLVCALLPGIEHRNNTWKQVLATPQSRANVFLSKFMNIHLLMIFFLVATHVFMWLVTIAIHFILPELDVLNQPLNIAAVWRMLGNSYVTILAVSVLQFLIGLKFKNFLVPVGIGVALWLIGTVMSLEYNSDLADYFPYSFHTFEFSPEHRPRLTEVKWRSLIYAVVFLVIGFWDFSRRRLNA